MGRHLFIVSRQHPQLYAYLARTFAAELDVEVLVDRRAGDRRGEGGRRTMPRGERRSAERRSAREVSEAVRALGYAFVRHM